MKVIAGLGNYGKKYENTRHNIGFVAVGRLASIYGVQIDKRHDFYLAGRVVIEGEDILLVKPHTYMNRSGIAVNSVLTDNSLLPSDLVVIHDDIDLNIGKVKRKFGGGDAGHRGIRSVIESLSSGDFYRIRIGVDRPPESMEASDYVLSPFRRNEQEIVNNSVEKAIDFVKEIIKIQVKN